MQGQERRERRELAGQEDGQVFLRRGKLAGQGQAEAELFWFLPFVLDLNFDGAGAVLAEPDDGGQLDLDSLQRAQAEHGIQRGERGEQRMTAAAAMGKKGGSRPASSAAGSVTRAVQISSLWPGTITRAW